MAIVFGHFRQFLAERMLCSLCGLGDKDEAFCLLEKSYKEHAASMTYLGVDVFWDGFHSDPRYLDLLRRIGLPEAQ